MGEFLHVLPVDSQHADSYPSYLEHLPGTVSEGHGRKSASSHRGGRPSTISQTGEQRDPRHFGLILAIDCVRNIAEPVWALRAIRGLLDAEGLFVWSEPTGSTNPLENRDDSLARAADSDSFEILPVDSPVQAFYGLRR